MANVERIPLGPIAQVRDLFSFPNNCHTVCFLKQTLEETVAHYLTASIQRDGFTDSSVQVVNQDGTVFASVSGSAAEAYAKLLPEYLAVGQLGLDASKSLWNEKKWHYNWTFFLPHGVSMTRHRSVQLLHFPPDYVLERDQDYLLAHTTLRWAALLVENGASPDETVRLQNIIDIAPIAAPSNDGKSLEGVYSFYSGYINGLLNLWIPSSGGGVRPLVAFGGPVRAWLKEQYKLDLSVLELATLKLPSGPTVPVLAANHPSFIYNAVKKLQDDPKTPEDEPVAVGMRVMQQDLIASMWQVEMSKNPMPDAEETLTSCKAKWSDPAKQRRICELTYEQAFDKSPEDSQKLCAHLPLIEEAVLGITRMYSIDSLDRRIELLRRDIGAAESAEPDAKSSV